MSSSRGLIIAILVCSLVLATGCSGPAGTAAPSPSPPELITLESLVLTPSDIPQNFTLRESRVKNSTEVSKLARDLGWQQGYVVRFTRPPEGISGQIEILQTVTRYPAKNIPAIAARAEKQERSDTALIFTNLSSPALGSYSQAFSGTVQTLIIPEPVTGNLSGPGSVEGTVKQDFVEIIFSKGDILEVLRMTGEGADYATLTSLAQKAYAKIP
ncbi:MAG TPA: hypothetical protein VN227_06710 [Methanoregula sp.]|nr:hypothetical protein [Methanoregula sp.]